ncbi:hypothetical protein [Buttiauxella ferragutiae]|uniref:hypothetical protein n=1 Tax=Buttiauxella ferragutiae TaxID=82989 RepID=UPI001F530FFE|nr:hypothetical protein [Buttiauxella ferragutiae]UNK63443.1 hypothetical protein MNO13_11365 [Buttiauxella ferragutiae]
MALTRVQREFKAGNKNAAIRYFFQTQHIGIALSPFITKWMCLICFTLRRRRLPKFHQFEGISPQISGRQYRCTRKKFDEPKVKATCDAGDLKFREATEYAAGKHDESRLHAIRYLDNVFKNNCEIAITENKLFSVVFAKEEIDNVKPNYDLAIRGESSRVGNQTK